MDQAFIEAAAHVRNGLDSLGIRWNDEAEQAAVCTILIQAGKSGWLLPWNPPPVICGPAKPQNAPTRPVSRPVTQLPDDLCPILAQSVVEAKERRSGPRPVPSRETSDGAPATGAASTPKSSFDVMIRAFHEIEADLPPEVFTAVLAWHGVTVPEDFRPDQVTKAASCYVALKTARDQYRADQQITAEHFEAIEEGWR
jgi:hypothetical protein